MSTLDKEQRKFSNIMFEYTITDNAFCQCVTAKGRIDALAALEIQKVFNKLILEGGHL